MTACEVFNQVYNTARWQALRITQLMSKRVCRCGKLATTVHHTQPIRAGGDPWDRKNLQSLCYRCHQRIHEAPERRAWKDTVNSLLFFRR